MDCGECGRLPDEESLLLDKAISLAPATGYFGQEVSRTCGSRSGNVWLAFNSGDPSTSALREPLRVISCG